MTQVERLHRVGILRQRTGRSGFRYVYAHNGRAAGSEVGRIIALKLPPAWQDVAIHPSPQARLQAVGRDAAGRWQYVYHENFVRLRERRKFERLLRFGAALPRLRTALRRDLGTAGLGRDKVLASVVQILACAFIRPGSEVYAAENGTYGIATLRRKHLRVKGDTLYFDFPAKSGKRQQRELRDAKLARIARKLLALPGYEVFKYVDDGKVIDVKRAHINDYIKRNMGEIFTAKDFRTWTGTLICACALARSAPQIDAPSKTSRKRLVVNAIKETAQQLGNTPAICRASYICPAVLSSFERGQLIENYLHTVEQLAERRSRALHRAERSLLRLLAQQAQKSPGS